MGFFVQFARFSLIFFNFLFWLAGICMLGLSIWIMVDPYLSFKLCETDLIGMASMSIISYLLIGISAFSIIIGFIGYFGALKKNQVFIAIYIIIIVLILLSELAVGVMAILFKEDAIKMLTKPFNEPTSLEFRDIIQSELKCCGIDGPDDVDVKIVPSCCVLKDDSRCKIEKENILDWDQCSNRIPTFVNHSGCDDKINEFVNKYGYIFIYIGFGVAGFQVFGLLIAITLICSLRPIYK
ncbi:integral membrane protein [Intoshia linei]|uniref:Tetraspanin n=1 Tax=Intoshia linei TaxID=1819745 RepID=A0A177B803_9BILA|nr:integral membrane protein [Intoshia linei]